jgi:tetratricopeptide (TPR) repeat protein
MLFAVQGRLAMRVALLFFAPLLLLPQDDSLSRKSQHAKELMGAGEFAQAVPIYEELSQKLPSNVGLRLNLALAYHMAGRQKEAIPEFQRVLKSDPKSIPALLSLGAAYLELNQPAEAVAPLQGFVALQPDHVPGRGMLANALLSLGRPKEAIVQFRKLTTLTPQDPKAWYGLGRSYEALARAAFEHLNKTAQGSAEWLALVAESRVEARQFRSAFYFYREALKKSPQLRGAHLGLAEVYRKTGHPDWAAVEEKKESALPPADCIRDKPACAFARGRLDEAAAGASPYWQVRASNQLALQSFQQLGSLPVSVELHALKAEILAGHGDHLEAAGEWRAAQKLAGGDPRIARQLAAALYSARDYANAVPALEQQIKAEPNAADLQFFLGDSWLQQAQPEKAVQPLEKAVQLDPNLLPAQAALGMAYARLNRPEEAIPHLQTALAIDDEGSLHYQLALALRKSGKLELSGKAMNEYQAIQRRSEEQKQRLEQEAAITAPQAPAP